MQCKKWLFLRSTYRSLTWTFLIMKIVPCCTYVESINDKTQQKNKVANHHPGRKARNWTREKNWACNSSKSPREIIYKEEIAPWPRRKGKNGIKRNIETDQSIYSERAIQAKNPGKPSKNKNSIMTKTKGKKRNKKKYLNWSINLNVKRKKKYI